jgi:hypothetical protein
VTICIIEEETHNTQAIQGGKEALNISNPVYRTERPNSSIIKLGQWFAFTGLLYLSASAASIEALPAYFTKITIPAKTQDSNGGQHLASQHGLSVHHLYLNNILFVLCRIVVLPGAD